MSSTAVTALGVALLALLLAGYLGQNYLPKPKSKILGIDLGTTFSCIGVYQSGSGNVIVIPDSRGKKCIPSIVAFWKNEVLVGFDAQAQAENNSANTIYDTKRFIGKPFKPDELSNESHRYPFKMVLDKNNMVRYVIGSNGNYSFISPEQIGSHILRTLKKTAEKETGAPLKNIVMSVPAEFNEMQRNYTQRAAELAGMNVLRIINEPTAAALAYGLHKKTGVHNVMVVDLGGGTLDVSLLNIQGGMFLTQAMAGNNHLGGQDFNVKLMNYLLKQIADEFHKPLSAADDLQVLRDLVETAKLNLTNSTETHLSFNIHSFQTPSRPRIVFRTTITRAKFESLNSELFKKILDPIRRTLEATESTPDDIDEVVLVGGSTRIPFVRQLIRDFFKKQPNLSIDPELAVVSGVAVQAGILGNNWPLTVSAIELPTKVKKIQLS